MTPNTKLVIGIGAAVAVAALVYLWYRRSQKDKATGAAGNTKRREVWSLPGADGQTLDAWHV